MFHTQTFSEELTVLSSVNFASYGMNILLIFYNRFYCGFQCKFIAPGADASGRVLVRGNEGRNGDYGTFLSQESTKEPMCDVKVNWMKTGSGPGHLPPRPRGRENSACPDRRKRHPSP